MLTHPTGPADVDNTAELRAGLRWLAARYPYTVGLLVVYVLTLGPPSVYLQSLAAAVGIVFFGLPHGAVDTLVAHKLKLTKNPFRLAGFLVAYLGLAAVAVAFWLVAPTAALLTFLLISAWHFGGDWSPTIVGFDRFIVGVALLCTTTLFHQDDVATIFASLVEATDADLLASSMFAIACTLLPVAACLPFKPEIRSTAPRVPIIATLTAALVLHPSYFSWPTFAGTTVRDTSKSRSPACAHYRYPRCFGASWAICSLLFRSWPRPVTSPRMRSIWCSRRGFSLA